MTVSFCDGLSKCEIDGHDFMEIYNWTETDTHFYERMDECTKCNIKRHQTKYKDSINYDQFWEWCRHMTREGHKVFISEYSAPPDFTCLWEKEVNCDLVKNNSKRTEKLHTFINSKQDE